MPMKQRCGVLVYNKERDRIDIRFDLNNYYGGLHCGQCFDVMVGGRWVPTRIEMASTWYLVGIQTDNLIGLSVRIKVNLKTQKKGGLRLEVRASARDLLFAIYPPIISIELIGTGQPTFITVPFSTLFISSE